MNRRAETAISRFIALRAAALLTCAGVLSVYALDEDAHEPAAPAQPVQIKTLVATETKNSADTKGTEEETHERDDSKKADVVDLAPLKNPNPAPPRSIENSPPPAIDIDLDEEAVNARLKVLKERQAAREREFEAACSGRHAAARESQFAPIARAAQNSSQAA